MMAAVSYELGEGAESGAGPLDHRANVVGARRLSNQYNWLAVDGDETARVAGFSPRSPCFIMAVLVHLPGRVISS